MFNLFSKENTNKEKEILLIYILSKLQELQKSDFNAKAEERFNKDKRLNNHPYRDKNKLFYSLGYVDCISDINEIIKNM